jgi:hypothetical protein
MREYSEVKPIIFIKKEWKLCKVIKRVLKLFYNFIRSVSKD